MYHYDDHDDDCLIGVDNVGLNLKHETCEEGFEDFHDYVLYTIE